MNTKTLSAEVSALRPPLRSESNATRMALVAGAILTLVLLAAYAGTLRSPFVYDDFASIADNPTIQRIGWRTLFPPVEAGVGGRPLLNVSFALDAALGIGGTVAYHVTNLVIHVLASCVLLALVRRTTASVRLAFGSALLFALHPLQTEAVTYISERAESLMGLFYLLTIYAFVRYMADRAWQWGVVSIACCVAGLATKETMVTAPVLVFLYDRVFVAKSVREVFGTPWRRRYYGFLAATWVMLIPSLISLSRRGVGWGTAVGAGTYVREEVQAIAGYFRLLVWPHRQVFDYGRQLEPDGKALIVGAAIVVGSIISTAFAWWRGRRAVAYLGIAAVIVLAPTTSVVPIALEPMAEHRMYLVVAAASVAVAALLCRYGRAGVVACCVVALAEGAVTYGRNGVYRSEIDLWRDTAEKCPRNDRAEAGWAMALCRSGQIAAALPHFEAALRLNPDYAPARLDYGNALLAVGRPRDAETQLRQAVALQPDFPQAHFDLGLALERQHRFQDAVTEFAEAVRERPRWGMAAAALARAESREAAEMQQAQRPLDAIAQLRRAAEIDPSSAPIRHQLGLTLAAAGRNNEAVVELARAAELEPRSAEIQNDFGVALANVERRRDAVVHFQMALQLAPDMESARKNLELADRMIGAESDGTRGETSVR